MFVIFKIGKFRSYFLFLCFMLLIFWCFLMEVCFVLVHCSFRIYLMLDILMLTLYLMNSNHFPSLLFFSFRLFLIYFLPSLVGLLKAGFLISGLCLLSRWASWCNCECSINSPVGRVFFCFRDSLSMSILVMFSLVGWYSWVMSSSSFSYSVSMFCV